MVIGFMHKLIGWIGDAYGVKYKRVAEVGKVLLKFELKVTTLYDIQHFS